MDDGCAVAAGKLPLIVTSCIITTLLPFHVPAFRQHGCYGVSLVSALRHTAVWWLRSLVGKCFASYCSMVQWLWSLVGKLLCVVVSAASATIELLGLVCMAFSASG